MGEIGYIFGYGLFLAFCVGGLVGFIAGQKSSQRSGHEPHAPMTSVMRTMWGLFVRFRFPS